MEIDLTFDVNSFDELTKATQSALIRARNKAVHATLYDTRDKLRNQIKKNFDNPKPYVVNSVRVKTRSLLGNDPGFLGEIYVDDYPSRGGTAGNEILYPHMVGGRRSDKRGEQRLRAMGVLPGNLQVVPTKDYRDSRGNLKSGLMTKILSDINAFPEYMSMNRINSGSVQPYKRSRVKSARFFVMSNNDGRVKRGIYEIVGKSGPNRRLKMVLAFVPITYTKKRFFFYEAVDKAFGPTVFGVKYNHFARIYTRSGSPDFARFVQAQARFRSKLKAAQSGVSDFGPRLPMAKPPSIKRGATVGSGFFKRS